MTYKKFAACIVYVSTIENVSAQVFQTQLVDSVHSAGCQKLMVMAVQST